MMQYMTRLLRKASSAGSSAYQAAFTAIAYFRLKHGGRNSLQYADDLLNGSMTAEEYTLVRHPRPDTSHPLTTPMYIVR